MFSKAWNHLLPIVAVSVSSCALLKALESRSNWDAAIYSIMWIYSAAVTMSRMK